MAALAASSVSGCEALSAGSLTTIAGRAPGSDVSAPAARRCTTVISAALNVVGIAATRGRVAGGRAAASAFAVSMTRPPPSATISSPGSTIFQQLTGQLVDAPGRDVVHDAARSVTAGAIAAARGVVSRV